MDWKRNKLYSNSNDTPFAGKVKEAGYVRLSPEIQEHADRISSILNEYSIKYHDNLYLMENEIEDSIIVYEFDTNKFTVKIIIEHLGEYGSTASAFIDPVLSGYNEIYIIFNSYYIVISDISQIKESVDHELVHVFDEKLTSPDLNPGPMPRSIKDFDPKGHKNYKNREYSKEYMDRPSEIDAFMTSTINTLIRKLKNAGFTKTEAFQYFQYKSFDEIVGLDTKFYENLIRDEKSVKFVYRAIVKAIDHLYSGSEKKSMANIIPSILFDKVASTSYPTLLVIDVQPEMDKYEPGYDHCSLARLMSEYKTVIYIVDENMAGHNTESLSSVHPKIKEYLIDPPDPDLSEEELEEYYERECNIGSHIDLMVKAFGGHLRTAMDFGIEDEAISFFRDVKNNVPVIKLIDDHRDFISRMQDEYGRDDDIEEFTESLCYSYTELITGIPNEVWKRGPFDIAGGHRDACVREVTMALEILGVDYNLLENLIYKQRSSLNAN